MAPVITATLPSVPDIVLHLSFRLEHKNSEQGGFTASCALSEVHLSCHLSFTPNDSNATSSSVESVRAGYPELPSFCQHLPLASAVLAIVVWEGSQHGVVLGKALHGGCILGECRDCLSACNVQRAPRIFAEPCWSCRCLQGPPSVPHVNEDFFKAYFGAAHVSEGGCPDLEHTYACCQASARPSVAHRASPGRALIPVPLALLQLAVAICSFPGRILGSEVRPRRFK